MPVKKIISNVPILGNQPMVKHVGEDSIFPSLFQNSLIEKNNSKPQIHITQYDYTFAIILFIGFIMFVWLYASNRKRLNQVIKAFYINRYANQLAREEVSLGNRVSVFLSSLFVLTLSMFILQVNQYFGFLETKNYLYSFVLVGMVILLMYFVKVIGIKFLGFVFQTSKEASDYIMAVFLFGNTMGLFLLPIIICLAFARQIPPIVFISCGLGIVASFFVVRLLRGFIIGFNSVRISKFYLFLYLCTLEILPFAILVKLFFLKIK